MSATPMNPERELRRLCREHAVPISIGERLLPLLRRAARAEGELRKRLLEVVHATLARDAEDLSVPTEAVDERCLLGLASALHRWPVVRSDGPR